MKNNIFYQLTVFFLILLLFFIPMTTVLQSMTVFAAKKQMQIHKQTEDYSQYSNEKISFGLGLHTDHTVPSGERPKGVKLKDYNAYYYDIRAKKKDPVVYLTFDCGYENGYTKKILKTLKKKKVKAIFFVTEAYIKSAPKLVKQMKKEGHLVGNHTCSHPQLTGCSVSRIKKEVSQCAKTMKELTGYEIDPYIRPPEGVYSVRVLKVLQDMGYATFLWSLAYYDYDTNKQPWRPEHLWPFSEYSDKDCSVDLKNIYEIHSSLRSCREIVDFQTAP